MMRSLIKRSIFVPIALVILALGLPLVFVIAWPQMYNALAQLLFDLVLFGASIWLGIVVSATKARKDEAGKWLVIAEGACNELLAISAQIDRMRTTRTPTCDALASVFNKTIDGSRLRPVQQTVQLRCEECTRNLDSIRDRVENNYRLWDGFINRNCDDDECTYFHDRLGERKAQLDASVQQTASAIVRAGRKEIQ